MNTEIAVENNLPLMNRNYPINRDKYNEINSLLKINDF